MKSEKRERMGRWMMLQKGPEDNWKRDEDKKGGCGLLSRLRILRNSAEKAQMRVKRETNKQFLLSFWP